MVLSYSPSCLQICLILNITNFVLNCILKMHKIQSSKRMYVFPSNCITFHHMIEIKIEKLKSLLVKFKNILMAI